MADEQKEIPEFIDTFYKKKKKLKILADTTAHNHHAAHQYAVDSLLKNDKGEVDYSKLEDEEIQEKFADKMKEHYISKIKAEFGINKEFDSPEEEALYENRLIEMATGVSKDTLYKFVKQAGENYKIEQHMRLGQRHVEDLLNKLQPTTHDHLKDEHIGDIVKYTQAEGVADPSKMRKEDAAELLSLSDKGQHNITKKDLKNAPYLIK